MAETNTAVGKSTSSPWDSLLWDSIAYTGAAGAAPQIVDGRDDDGRTWRWDRASADPEWGTMQKIYNDPEQWGYANYDVGTGDGDPRTLNYTGGSFGLSGGAEHLGGSLQYDSTTGDYTVYRNRENGGKRGKQYATYKLENGKLVRSGDWQNFDTQSTGEFVGPGLLAFAALAGGAALGGLGSGGAAGSAAGGSSGVITGGSGLSASGVGAATGSGLGATAGSGLTLAGTTGTGAGLAAGTGSGIIGSGIGSTIGAGLGGAAVSGSSSGAMGLDALRAAELAGYESAPGALVNPAVAAGAESPTLLAQAGELIKQNPQLAKLGVKGLAAALAGGAAASAAGGGSGMDTSGLMGLFAKSSAIADKQLAMADEVYADAKSRYGQYAPLFDEIMRNSLDQSKKAGAMSDKLYAQYTDVFMPANQKMVDTAMNYDTAGRRMGAAADAAADVEQTHALALADANREMARNGISVNNTGGTTLDLALAKARDRAAAQTGAVRDVEKTGISLVSDAAKTGLSVAQLGNQTAQTGASLGDTATRALTNQQALALAGPQAAAQLQGNAVSALNSAGNLYANSAQIANQQQALKNQGYAGLGSLAGTLLTAGKDSVVGQGLDWLLS